MSRKVNIILILVLVVYTLLTIFNPGGLIAYAFPSACWVFISVATLWICGPKRIRLWFNKRVFIMAALIAAFQIFALIDAGFITGFGTSPVSFTPLGVTLNAILVLSTLLGIELSRGCLIKNSGKKRPFLTLMLVTLLYTFINTSIIGLLNLSTPLTIAQFLGTALLPTLTENLLASYLALQGGPTASLAYRGPIQAFKWFSPIQPTLTWGFEALIGVMIPTIGFVAMNPAITTRKSARRIKAEKSSLRGWLIVSALCFTMVWSVTGLLGFYPTVIYSGSMRPTVDVGDIAIVVQTSPDDIYPGDIIQFYREGEMVLHRVVEIREGLFVTKGDNNPTPDSELVLPAQIRGKLAFNIPELGWASILVKNAISQIWSFLSRNLTVAYSILAVTFAACIYKVYVHRRNPALKWKRLHRRRGWLGK